ncbi:ATP-binding protein [Streptomyces sp. NBC_00669]|uniref:HAMP domain-containing sensor histidine kinase n=1 Tax=Streptomyces sp. NBC_00669 TaxID=2976011 RepID=UPI002E373B5B|nr:ATP-binding protein [Streptomyces sp. NBC_00669]
MSQGPTGDPARTRNPARALSGSGPARGRVPAVVLRGRQVVRGWLRQLWEALRPWDPTRSIKAALQALVIASVMITTLLVTLAIHSRTEIRVITIFSIIASLLITQIVATNLTAPLREMTAVARAMAGGDYTRRVARVRRDEVGELAETFNRMAADLAAVDRHRKELVANVSHELRTPIAALRAVLENVVDGVSAADPETMRLALQQTERLGKLVSQLLDLSRLDSGAVRLDAKRFEVWPYLSAVLKTASLGADRGKAGGTLTRARADVPLHLDVSPPELVAYADGERLHQVVANLVDNAMKHSPPGGRVTVRARGGSAPGSLDLEVRDEGPGIPEADRVRVFDRFHRGSHPGTDGGTGLGLAIARWAVDLHGGRIEVAESPRGCRIHVTLPGMPPQPR